MTYVAEELTEVDIRAYRLARFGEAGHSGRLGVTKAGKHHGGVQSRTWYNYENGTRRPPIAELRKMARWLNQAAAMKPAKPKRRAANIEVSLGRASRPDEASPPSASPVDADTSSTEVPVAAE